MHTVCNRNRHVPASRASSSRPHGFNGSQQPPVARRDRALFLLSLRVLARFNEGVHPSHHDLSLLRRNAQVDEMELPVDELCCALIGRELGREDGAEALR
jgi:hypothetical protein